MILFLGEGVGLGVHLVNVGHVVEALNLGLLDLRHREVSVEQRLVKNRGKTTQQTTPDVVNNHEEGVSTGQIKHNTARHSSKHDKRGPTPVRDVSDLTKRKNRGGVKQV